MFEFHTDKGRYFEMQRVVTRDDIIPFIEQHTGACVGKRILEIGCAEAGVLKAFIEKGNIGTGVELSPSRYESAKLFLKQELEDGRFFIINKNIYDISDPSAEFGSLFDVIVLKDVIEHIPEQPKFINQLKLFLNHKGIIFFAYPPWWMPFGGHQQLCATKLLEKLPWFHLLPNFLYKFILKSFGESDATINELLSIKSTGIIIETLHKIIKKEQFEVVSEQFWFINPIYRMKFGLKSRLVPTLLAFIPYLRNFYTTTHYILFKMK
ncbi:MAG: methyltransferase domain-containing protein [Saprospiraceae bacterium]|nr:methyltransferase domain-containing protein [Saprospiraceae bacterium]